jgi:hypothetical protein
MFPVKHVEQHECSSPECSNPRRPGGRYCRQCHAAAQKRYRDRDKWQLRTLAWERARGALDAAGWDWRGNRFKGGKEDGEESTSSEEGTGAAATAGQHDGQHD